MRVIKKRVEQYTYTIELSSYDSFQLADILQKVLQNGTFLSDQEKAVAIGLHGELKHRFNETPVFRR